MYIHIFEAEKSSNRLYVFLALEGLPSSDVLLAHQRVSEHNNTSANGFYNAVRGLESASKLVHCQLFRTSNIMQYAGNKTMDDWPLGEWPAHQIDGLMTVTLKLWQSAWLSTYFDSGISITKSIRAAPSITQAMSVGVKTSSSITFAMKDVGLSIRMSTSVSPVMAVE